MSTAEKMEDLEVKSCSETSECSTLDSDLKDLGNSEAGDANSWCELPQIIELRTKLQTEIMNTERKALTLEKEICENHVSEEKSLCGSCGLVREPRQRKIAELRLMHQAMLKTKPKRLLCIAGMMTRLEEMILEGYLDFFYCGSASNVDRCRQCRQIKDAAKNKDYLMLEITEILKEERKKCSKSKECSMSKACSACLNFMLKNLKPSVKAQITEPLKTGRPFVRFDIPCSHILIFIIILFAFMYFL